MHMGEGPLNPVKRKATHNPWIIVNILTVVIINELVLKRLLDGQFEECGLTFTELHRTEESLCKSLIALYHARIKYPELKNRAS